MANTTPIPEFEVIHHLPGLAQERDESYAALDGRIARLALEEFQKLDDIWAHGNYYDQRSTVWRGAVAADTPEGAINVACKKARLVQLAATVVCEAPLPDPILSIAYACHGSPASVMRLIGPLERTWLLSDQAVAAPTHAQWQEIARLSETWHDGGLSSDSAVLHPLQAYGSVHNTLRGQPALMMMPIMVALEGTFAPGKARGIAQRMAANLARVLPDVPDLADRVRALYAIRSDIVHGRDFSQEQATAAFETVGSIACRAAGALASAMAQARSSDPRTVYGAWD